MANAARYLAIFGDTAAILENTATVLKTGTIVTIFLKNCEHFLEKFGDLNVHLAVSDGSAPILGRKDDGDKLYAITCKMLSIPHVTQLLAARALTNFVYNIFENEANRQNLFVLLGKHRELLSPLLTSFVSCRLAILPEPFFDHAVKNGW